MDRKQVAYSVAGAVLAVIAVVAVSNEYSHPEPVAAVAPAPTNTPMPTAAPTAEPTADPTAVPTAAPTAPPAPKIIATFSGNGIKTTPRFSTPDEWVLNWTYDCSNFSPTGNFIVMEYGENGSFPSVLANELGKGGPGTNNQHGDGGSRYLEVNSECRWTVSVVG